MICRRQTVPRALIVSVTWHRNTLAAALTVAPVKVDEHAYKDLCLRIISQLVALYTDEVKGRRWEHSLKQRETALLVDKTFSNLNKSNFKFKDDKKKKSKKKKQSEPTNGEWKTLYPRQNEGNEKTFQENFTSGVVAVEIGTRRTRLPSVVSLSRRGSRRRMKAQRPTMLLLLLKLIMWMYLWRVTGGCFLLGTISSE